MQHTSVYAAVAALAAVAEAAARAPAAEGNDEMAPVPHRPAACPGLHHRFQPPAVSLPSHHLHIASHRIDADAQSFDQYTSVVRHTGCTFLPVVPAAHCTVKPVVAAAHCTVESDQAQYADQLL